MPGPTPSRRLPARRSRSTLQVQRRPPDQSRALRRALGLRASALATSSRRGAAIDSGSAVHRPCSRVGTGLERRASRVLRGRRAWRRECDGTRAGREVAMRSSRGLDPDDLPSRRTARSTSAAHAGADRRRRPRRVHRSLVTGARAIDPPRRRRRRAVRRATSRRHPADHRRSVEDAGLRAPTLAVAAVTARASAARSDPAARVRVAPARAIRLVQAKSLAPRPSPLCGS